TGARTLEHLTQLTRRSLSGRMCLRHTGRLSQGQKSRRRRSRSANGWLTLIRIVRSTAFGVTASHFRSVILSSPASSGRRGLMEQNEAWQGPVLPEEVWLAPARVHRQGEVNCTVSCAGIV